MNGGQALIRTLVDSGVDVCFANPGTSEMHFVAALDDVPEMRGVLALFEGVATGAADGYARVAGKPAATLLHLGPGLGNGLANLHNARRGHTPMVNIVGDHATYHKRYDAPLESDIAGLAETFSSWYRCSLRAEDVADDAAQAVAAAYGPPGGIATLVLPADVSWSESTTGPAAARHRQGAPLVPAADIAEVAKVLRSGEPTTVLLGGKALDARGLLAAARIAAGTGARLLGETFPANLERGAGLPALDRLGYLAEFAQAQLEGVRHLVTVDALSPVSFFAYPGRPSDLVPAGCTVHVLATGRADVSAALEALAEEVAADEEPALAQALRPERPTGELTMATFGAAVGATLPEGAIVVDESNTAGLFVAGATSGAPRHNWLTLTGGAIGYGMPSATGAAVAAPDRPVVSLEADGSAMYTFQALWTQARERLDVTTVLLSNRSYAILNLELGRVGAGAGGPAAQRMLSLADPTIDFVALASGLGVEARRATSAEELVAALEWAYAEHGPHLIEAVLPEGLG